MRKPIDANPERLYLACRFEYVDVEPRRDAELGRRQTVDPTSEDRSFMPVKPLEFRLFRRSMTNPMRGLKRGGS
jgi:hypothetical protein